MSKVKIEGNASGTGTFTIQAPNSNSDRVLSLPDSAGEILTDAGVPASALPAGSVLQVKSTTKTDTWSSSLTAGQHADVTGLNVSITPSSTSSKILLMVSLTGHNGNEGGLGFYIKESGVMINQPDSTGSYGDGMLHAVDLALTSTELQTSSNFQTLHSPASTSALTYQVRLMNYASATRTLYVNRPSGTVRYYTVSTITAMEIAG